MNIEYASINFGNNDKPKKDPKLKVISLGETLYTYNECITEDDILRLEYTRKIEFCEDFSQNIDNLPNNITEICLGKKFKQKVNKFPKMLKYLSGYDLILGKNALNQNTIQKINLASSKTIFLRELSLSKNLKELILSCQKIVLQDCIFQNNITSVEIKTNCIKGIFNFSNKIRNFVVKNIITKSDAYGIMYNKIPKKIINFYPSSIINIYEEIFVKHNVSYLYPNSLKIMDIYTNENKIKIPYKISNIFLKISQVNKKTILNIKNKIDILNITKNNSIYKNIQNKEIIINVYDNAKIDNIDLALGDYSTRILNKNELLIYTMKISCCKLYLQQNFKVQDLIIEIYGEHKEIDLSKCITNKFNIKACNINNNFDIPKYINNISCPNYDITKDSINNKFLKDLVSNYFYKVTKINSENNIVLLPELLNLTDKLNTNNITIIGKISQRLNKLLHNEYENIFNFKYIENINNINNSFKIDKQIYLYFFDIFEIITVNKRGLKNIDQVLLEQKIAALETINSLIKNNVKKEHNMALVICINELHKNCHKNISSYYNTFETATEQIKDKLKQSFGDLILFYPNEYIIKY